MSVRADFNNRLSSPTALGVAWFGAAVRGGGRTMGGALLAALVATGGGAQESERATKSALASSTVYRDYFLGHYVKGSTPFDVPPPDFVVDENRVYFLREHGHGNARQMELWAFDRRTHAIATMMLERHGPGQWDLLSANDRLYLARSDRQEVDHDAFYVVDPHGFRVVRARKPRQAAKTDEDQRDDREIVRARQKRFRPLEGVKISEIVPAFKELATAPTRIKGSGLKSLGWKKDEQIWALYPDGHMIWGGIRLLGLGSRGDLIVAMEFGGPGHGYTMGRPTRVFGLSAAGRVASITGTLPGIIHDVRAMEVDRAGKLWTLWCDAHGVIYLREWLNL